MSHIPAHIEVGRERICRDEAAIDKHRLTTSNLQRKDGESQTGQKPLAMGIDSKAKLQAGPCRGMDARWKVPRAVALRYHLFSNTTILLCNNEVKRRFRPEFVRLHT